MQRRGRVTAAMLAGITATSLLAGCGGATTTTSAPVPSFVVPTSPSAVVPPVSATTPRPTPRPTTRSSSPVVPPAPAPLPTRYISSPDLRPGQFIGARAVNRLCPEPNGDVQIRDLVTATGRAPTLPRPLTAMVVCPHLNEAVAPSKAVVITDDAQVAKWARRIASMTDGQCVGTPVAAGRPVFDVTFVGRDGRTTQVRIDRATYEGSGPVSRHIVLNAAGSFQLSPCGPADIINGLVALPRTSPRDVITLPWPTTVQTLPLTEA